MNNSAIIVSDDMDVSSGVIHKQDIECFTLDVPSYASRYEGYTKLKRLLFIAENSSNLREQALACLQFHLKKGINTALYLQLAETFPSFVADMKWVAETEKSCESRYQRFESELLAAKSTTVKEAIRLGHINIADFYYQRGNLAEALKSYSRTKDFCSQHRHAFDMHMHAISISIDMDQYRNIGGNVAKAMTVGTDLESKAKLKCITALQALHDRNYAISGRLFCDIGPELSGRFASVIAEEDIVLYAVLCCLASLERTEIHNLLENPAFKTQLELVPDLRQLLSDLFGSKFTACKQYIQQMKNQWKLDIYLRNHVDQLISEIFNKFILWCFVPYSTMMLENMSNQLDTPIVNLETQLVELIVKDKLGAIIDKANGTLVRVQDADRDSSLGSIVTQSSQQVAFAQQMLLRLSIVKNNIHVTATDIETADFSIVKNHKHSGESMDETN